MKRVAIIGTVGVPAKYGGFETLAENILGENCSPDVCYTVYCSAPAYTDRPKSYKEAQLKYVPLKANGSQSIPYDIWSVLRASLHHDVLLVLGVSGAMVLPLVRLFSKRKIIVNIDGLEHRRDKWGLRTRKLLKYLEKIAVRNAHVVVADNKAIADYVTQEYGRQAVLIAYGGDHALCDVSRIEQGVLAKYSLEANNYAFSVCRIEPENNVHTTLEAFAEQTTQPLVFVGNWQNSDYGRSLIERYGTQPNITLLDPIYDIATLNVLRKNCSVYIHGHSAGGTNPSLVEAMFFAKPILCFDVNYNRESTENRANYYTNASDLLHLIEELPPNGLQMLEIANRCYVWKTIAQQYKNLYTNYNE